MVRAVGISAARCARDSWAVDRHPRVEGIAQAPPPRGDPRDAIHNGWDEYVDNAVDAGYRRCRLPRDSRRHARTRASTAVRLARLTDAATFGDAERRS